MYSISENNGILIYLLCKNGLILIISRSCCLLSKSMENLEMFSCPPVNNYCNNVNISKSVLSINN